MASPRSVASEHRIVHKKPPMKWHDGFPLGNGEVGVMIWGDGNPLALTLDKADLWDLRSNDAYLSHPDFNYASLVRLVAEQKFAEADEIFEKRQLRDNPIGPTKISIGRMELRLGETTGYEGRLEIGTATIEGVIRTHRAAHDFRAFVHRERNLLCLRVAHCPAEAGMFLRPLAEMNESLAKLGHPPPSLRDEGALRVLAQVIPGGPAYAVAWNPSGPDFFAAIETAGSPDEAVAKAKATWRESSAKGFDALHAEHTRAWEAFWAGSAVYLPEPRMEFLWYHGLYLLASSSRRGSIPPGLQGVWPMDGVIPPWRGDYHADMNVQETFWPACVSGHLDLLDSWCDLMRAEIEPARGFTRRFFGTEGTFRVACTLPRHTIVPCWHTVQFAWSNSGWLAWLVWLRWRYSMDAEWLAATGYPVVSEVFKFYRANLKEEADGHLHIPLSSSPEYRENKPQAWCKDPNVDIALIRRCCAWVVEMEAALGKTELSASAQEVRAKLVPYHLTPKKELCLWAGKPLDESHRHPSHLMAVHPAMDLTVDDGPEARAIIYASLEHFFSLGQYRWAGHTYAQMASFGAVIGRAGFAYDCLVHFLEYWIGPNGLHFNRDMRSTGMTCYQGLSLQFTMEANCAIAAGIGDMLVQGWGDTLRVFPAAPDHWRDAAFRDLLAEGAFRVSAARREGRTAWVKVRAGARRQLRLRNPFGEGAVRITGGEARREGEFLLADLEKGQEIVFQAADIPADLDEAIARTRSSDATRLGLR